MKPDNIEPREISFEKRKLKTDIHCALIDFDACCDMDGSPENMDILMKQYLEVGRLWSQLNQVGGEREIKAMIEELRYDQDLMEEIEVLHG